MFVESLQIKNNKPQHVDYHNRRMFTTIQLNYGATPTIDLDEAIDTTGLEADKIYKCRVQYTLNITSIEIAEYEPKTVRSLKLVTDDKIDYSFKYTNRKALDNLLAHREDCDNILIVKNGHITDSAYANVIFSRGGQWYTPTTVLLNGTQRQYLLDTGQVQSCHITPADLPLYDQVMLINAMLPFDISRAFAVAAIV